MTFKSYEILFVYGTLMSGFSAHAFLVDSQFLSYGVLPGARLIHLEDGFPAVIEGEGEVFGEVYRIDDLTLKAIDLFEEYFETFPERSFFVRRKRLVKLLSLNTFLEAWVYLLNPKLLDSLSFTEVPFGNWKEFVKKLISL